MPTSIFADAQDVIAGPSLTVQAQAIGFEQVDPAGMYLFPQFFPFMDADGIDIESLFALDYRPAATRREWNAHGKEIPVRTPELQGLTMVPIEGRNGIGEEELHRIRQQAGGNQALFLNAIGARIPDRVRMLVEAVYRRTELDAARAWYAGDIVAKHPTGGASFTTSLGFDAARVATAQTAWNDGGTNAYDELVAWLADAAALVGNIVGVMTSRLVYNTIRGDAPNILDYGNQGVQAGRSNLESMISDDIGQPFRFILNETQVDVFTDGGSAVTRTRVWDESYVSVIPQGGQIGSTFRAPVESAYDALAEDPAAPIDVRGVAVRGEKENKGKYLDLLAQANWLSVPYEANVASIDTGINS
jgi:hypothetical protein